MIAKMELNVAAAKIPSRIVFTGGGTAGHVTPNLALIEALQKDGWMIDYIGSPTGVEKKMITELGLPYHQVSCGKLRRYFSWKNLTDPFKMMSGIVQSYTLIRRLKPNVVFSKGGFVALPVVVGAWLNRVPVVAHESDMSPGLANKLSFPFVNKLCVTFAGSKKHFKHEEKVEITGTPIRQGLFHGSKINAYEQCGFLDDKPCLLITGGSQGSTALNRSIRQALQPLCEQFNIIHLCGKGNVDTGLLTKKGYFQTEYANHELADYLAASDVIVSRAGANALFEILALGKPHILVPLSSKISRGDQVQNARFYEEQGISTVIKEEALTPAILITSVMDAYTRQHEITARIKALKIESGTENILSILRSLV